MLNNFAPVRVLQHVVTTLTVIQEDPIINIARFCFGLNMFTTLPLELFVCREVRILLYSDERHHLLCLGRRAVLLWTRELQPSTALVVYHVDIVFLYVLWATFFILQSWLNIRLSVSMITCDLGIVSSVSSNLKPLFTSYQMLEITGGVSATALAFVFPAICYYKLQSRELSWHSKTKLPAVICALFGLIILTLSLAIGLAKVWSEEGSTKLCT